jgi:hypothetical protein
MRLPTGGVICLDWLELALAAGAARQLDLPHDQAAPLNPVSIRGHGRCTLLHSLIREYRR